MKTTEGDGVQAGAIQQGQTPVTDAFANEYGLAKIAKADSKDARDEAFTYSQDKLGFGDDYKYEDTAAGKQQAALKEFDDKTAAKQRARDNMLFLTGAERTGSLSGGARDKLIGQLEAEKTARSNLKGRTGIAVAEEEKKREYTGKSLDKAFTAMTDTTSARNNALSTLASLTQTDYANQRDQLNRQLQAKAANDQKLQSALRTIATIDVAKEEAELRKAENAGNLKNYARQRLQEVNEGVDEIKASIMEDLGIAQLTRAAQAGDEQAKANLQKAQQDYQTRLALALGPVKTALIEGLAREAGVGDEAIARERAQNQPPNLSDATASYIQ